MNITKFEKVSLSAFKNACNDLGFNLNNIEEIYQNIQLPKRATKGSAGYDFHLPFAINLKKGDTIIIPTGIRCKMNQDLVLQIYPRSSLGFKYQLTLDNTVGIIDSDYYYALNEGHIMIKITNHSIQNKTLELEQGKAFAQGVFVKFYRTINDEAKLTRSGGMGSTNL